MRALATDEAAVADLIDLTYEAALEPASWPALMTRVSGAVGAGGAVQLDLDPGRARLAPVGVALVGDLLAHHNQR